MASPPVKTVSGTITIEVYSSGRIHSEKAFGPTSDAVAFVSSLLGDANRKWESSRITFAPDVLVRFDSTKLNFQQHRLILEHRDQKGNTTQFTTALSDEVRQKFEKLLNDAPSGTTQPSSSP